MNAHVTEWLNAYYDGELHGARRQQVETHLAECETCRADLESLEVLSGLLASAPQAEPQISVARFVSQVKLRLPEPAARPAWEQALRTGWTAAPAFAVSTWVFIQVVLFFTSVAPLLGLGELFGEQTLSGLAGWLPVLEIGAASLLSTALLAAFLAGWLVSLWAYRRHLDYQKESSLLAF